MWAQLATLGAPGTEALEREAQTAGDQLALDSGRVSVTGRLAPPGPASDSIAAAGRASITREAVAGLGPGQPLEPGVRASFEQRLGTHLGAIRLHRDAPAAQAAQQWHARAFAVGSHIGLAAGEPGPGTPRGRRLLAHEIVHTVQQSQGGGMGVQCFGEGSVCPTECPSSEELDELEAGYRQMIEEARAGGHDVAADNLEHFLGRSGTTRVLSVDWLRGFAAVTAAERKNEGRFENSLNAQANAMAHGDSTTFNDYWDAQLTPSQTKELYYASGTSTLTSHGSFSLQRIEDVVSISGTVRHHWHDSYDWNPGRSAYVPGHSYVSDDDAILLEGCGRGASFDMESEWKRTLSGTVTVGWLWNDRSFTWSGP